MVGAFACVEVVDRMPARLPRLDGVEHADGCPASGKALAFAGSAQESDASTTRVKLRAVCDSCGLRVELDSELVDRTTSGRR